MVGGTWTVMAATGPQVAVDRPAPDTVLSAGVITPAGTASAYEGTVVVQVLLSTAAGTQKVAEAVTTAEGTEHAPWSARVVTGGDVSGAGYVLASTTAGTDRGAPAFALVPVMFGASPGGAAVLPDDPRAYAQAALEAWLAGDAATLGELAAPEVVQALFAHAPAHETSSSPRCEGAAGSTACTWTASREEIVLRVDNAAAAARQRHAVFEARFEAR
jgi:hypothetical protein